MRIFFVISKMKGKGVKIDFVINMMADIGVEKNFVITRWKAHELKFVIIIMKRLRCRIGCDRKVRGYKVMSFLFLECKNIGSTFRNIHKYKKTKIVLFELYLYHV